MIVLSIGRPMVATTGVAVATPGVAEVVSIDTVRESLRQGVWIPPRRVHGCPVKTTAEGME